MTLEQEILDIINDDTFYREGWDGVTGETFIYGDRRGEAVLKLVEERLKSPKVVNLVANIVYDGSPRIRHETALEVAEDVVDNAWFRVKCT